MLGGNSMVPSIVTFAVALAVVLIVLKILGKSVKMLTSILINSIVGAIVLYVLHIFIPEIVVSWWAALITGFFGIPGVILVVILQLLVL